MSITANKFNSFVEELAHAGHDLETDQLTIALSNTVPVAGNSVIGDITEVSYTNLSTRNITTSSSGQTSGVYKLVLTNLTMQSTGDSTGPFRYVIIYNSGNNKLIAWYDYGEALTLGAGESLTVVFDSTNGAIKLE